MTALAHKLKQSSVSIITWSKDSGAHALLGVANTAFNIISVKVLSSNFNSTHFLVWTIAIQISVIINTLLAGIQSSFLATFAKAPHFVHSNANKMIATVPDDLITCSYRYSVNIFMILVLPVIAASMLIPYQYQSLDIIGKRELTISILLIGLSTCVNLFALPSTALLQINHRAHVYHMLSICSKLLSLLVIACVPWLHLGIQSVSALYAIATIIFIPFLIISSTIKGVKTLQEPKDNSSVTYSAEINSRLSALIIWALVLSTLNSGGFFFVSKINPSALKSFSIAFTLTLAFTGVYGSMISPFVVFIGKSISSSEVRSSRLLAQVTTCSSLGLGLMLAVAIACKGFILDLFFGPSLSSNTEGYLFTLLMIAFTVRNLCAPYSLCLLLLNKRGPTSYPAITEGLVFIIAAFFLSHFFKVQGVAYAFILAAISSIAAHVSLNFKQTSFLNTNYKFFLNCIIFPFSIGPLLLASLQLALKL